MKAQVRVRPEAPKALRNRRARMKAQVRGQRPRDGRPVHRGNVKKYWTAVPSLPAPVVGAGKSRSFGAAPVAAHAVLGAPP
jgi:hypothetical protein